MKKEKSKRRNREINMIVRGKRKGHTGGWKKGQGRKERLGKMDGREALYFLYPLSVKSTINHIITETITSLFLLFLF